MQELHLRDGDRNSLETRYSALTDLITDALALSFKLREMEVADHLLDALRTLYPSKTS